MLNESEISFLSLVPNPNEEYKKASDIGRLLGINSVDCENICINLQTLNKIELINRKDYGNPVYWVRKSEENNNQPIVQNNTIINNNSKGLFNKNTNNQNSTYSETTPKKSVFDKIINTIKGIFVSGASFLIGWIIYNHIS